MQKSKDPEEFYKILKNKNSDVGEKYKSIFELKSLATEQSQNFLIETFEALDDSELLKHEVCYALGQMKFNKIIEDFLVKIVENLDEKPIVRHEAGEALANSENPEMRKVLEKFKDSPTEEVRITCNLGIKKLDTYEYLKNRYACKYLQTREPAAPFNEEEMKAVLKLEGSLTKENEKDFYEKCLNYICNNNCDASDVEEVDIFDKYRTLYFLRDVNNECAIQTLCQIFDKANRDKTKILLRHEVCFILGQLESINSVDVLEMIIKDPTEHEIVRHEAISAYSTISKDKELLKQYATDKSRIVSESCLVALNLIDYWQNPQI